MSFGTLKKRLSYENNKLSNENLLMLRENGTGTGRIIELTENHVIQRQIKWSALCIYIYSTY